MKQSQYVEIPIYFHRQIRSNQKGKLTIFHADFRWIGLSREEEARLWDHSMIFSYGPRICIGKEYFLCYLIDLEWL